MKLALLLALTLVSTASAAHADRLPKSAVALTPAAVTAFYSGKTANYAGISKVFFDPDGTIKGVYGNPPKGWFTGTWSVKGNEGCMYPQENDGKQHPNCNKYWQVGKRLYSLWSVHDDGSAVDLKNGYTYKDASKYTPGNSIAALYAKFGGK